MEKLCYNVEAVDLTVVDENIALGGVSIRLFTF